MNGDLTIKNGMLRIAPYYEEPEDPNVPLTATLSETEASNDPVVVIGYEETSGSLMITGDNLLAPLTVNVVGILQQSGMEVSLSGHTHTASAVGAKPSGWKSFYAGTSAPSDTNQLWIDTTANTGGLKYYDGTAWTAVPVGYV